MTKAVPAALLVHYASDSTTLATCWRVTLVNGTVMGFTDHDSDLIIDGVTYIARGGFLGSDTETQTKLAVDNLEAAGFINTDLVEAGDLTSGDWDYAQVRIFIVNHRDLTMGTDTTLTGRLGRIQQDTGSFRAELRGLTNAYSQTIGEVYQPTCRATLGDTRCGVNLGPFTVTGTLTSTSSDGRVLFDTSRSEAGPTGGKTITAIAKAVNPSLTIVGHDFVVNQPVYIAQVGGMAEINGQNYVIASVPDADHVTIIADTTNFTTYTTGGTATPQGDSGFFDYGKITMTSGGSNGLSMEVKAYSPGTITLQLELSKGVAAGDTYLLVAGCGKRFTQDCVARFANGVRFRGEPHLPGMDKIIKIGRA